MNKMKIACAQYPITQFSEFEDWIQHTTEWVEEAVAMQAEILCFPEYGSMELTSLLKEQQDPSQQVVEMQTLVKPFIKTFSDLASDNEVVIIAPSIPVLEDKEYVNRTYVFDTKGNTFHQDKLFMTRFEAEDWNIRSGKKEVHVFSYKELTFGIQICYDNEFPVGAHLLCKNGAQLIVSPSCTETLRGATRVHLGCRARAMENQCYVAVTQTIGLAPWSPAVDINYGYSAFYSTPDTGQPELGIYGEGEHNVEGWEIYTLDLIGLAATRKDPAVFNFKDQSLIKIDHQEHITVLTHQLA